MNSAEAAKQVSIKPLASSNPVSLIKIIVHKNNPGVLDKILPDSSLLVSGCEAGAGICIINRHPRGTDAKTILPEPTSTSLGRGLCMLVQVGDRKPMGKAGGQGNEGTGFLRALGTDSTHLTLPMVGPAAELPTQHGD